MRKRFAVLAFVCLAGCTRDNPLAIGGDDGGVASQDGGGAKDDGGGMPDLSSAPATNDYGKAGPFAVKESTGTVERGLIDSYDVVLHVPSGNGPFPVVVLASGFMQSGAAYAPYARRLASWGVMAVTRDDPGFTTASGEIAEDLEHFVSTWLPERNQSGALASKLDLTRVGLAGHSRGAQAALLAAEGQLYGKVNAIFALDPVDSRPPGSPFATLARTKLPQIGIPTTFIGELTNSMGGTFGQACAPAADNYQVLYSAAPSPSVEITAIGADHGDFEDEMHCQSCDQCSPGAADGKVVLAYSVRYLTAFFARELLGDNAVGFTFAGAGAPADIASGLITIRSK